ncbi:APC membrane recruitment protein 1 [Protopterus annectens]|uniref:APC membrane recruitment protein 1 n=1 Tax=Protopterus annectens TaxID=7888 RepID=UPI001CFAE69D|nr:APC membrane recruitment protein 1 [Protopterus annectens]XP_043913654.1 APC membrane recruitment protein 1 [Protopterus annectens]XP_043913655.1 APC membrane recruitment protein 1 [Protopterus annectens]
MEADRNIEGAIKTEHFSDVCGESTRSQSEGSDLTIEFLDIGNPATDLQPPAKMKKTFKLFNMKRGILPNFFSKKDNGKALCKKVISKSKTHDGIIEVEHCDGKRGSIQNGSDAEKDIYHQRSFHDKTVSSSQSAHCDINTNSKLNFHKVSSLECIHKNLNAGKSSASPRPKKGLRGLLSSIRRHKKKAVVQRDSCDFSNIKDISIGDVNQEHANKQHESDPKLGKKLLSDSESELAQTMLPNSSGDKDNKTIPLESASDEKTLAADFSTSACRETVLAKEPKDIYKENSLSVKTDGAVLYRNSQFSSLPDIINSGYVESDAPSLHSYDQVSVLFDVTSLKSFDSLTGCGDDIADQDDDSIGDSTVSAERSKNAAKRSSCLVTYQGGGEEMATPDEVDEEYLQDLWENTGTVAECYETERLQSRMEHPEPNHSSDQHVSEMRANISHPGLTRATVENTDLLTPQSDQQESAPNSDEGYYDSNTPGTLDEGGDGFNQNKKDRLPRDSYSGDALYELYDPDDSPMNPPFDDSLDTKIPCLNTAETFFSLSEKADNFSHFFSQKLGVMETEEERLAVIQQQLLCWELKRMNVSTSKALDLLDKAKRAIEKQTFECNSRADVTNVLEKMQQNCFAGEQAILQPSNLTVIGNNGVCSRTDKQNSLNPCRKNKSEGSEGQVICASYSSEKLCKGTSCDSDLVKTELEQKNKLSSQQTNHFELLKMSNNGNTAIVNDQKRLDDFSTEKEKFSREYEQAVNFSQALVEFTSNGTSFPNISESLDCSDSGSFTQSLPSLPVMVTFDVVDVENEGGCDQQIEMSTADEIEASFEAFDDSCVQKESFAEYDDRMFHAHAYNSFSNSWGVASLPRHLSLYRTTPSIPMPLSLNRRSRSLDTDSLESELSNVPLPKGRIPSLELHKADWGGKKVSKGCPLADYKCNNQSFYSEMKDTTGIKPYTPSQQDPCSIPGDGKRQKISTNCSVVKDRWQHLEAEEINPPFVPVEQWHSKHSCSRGSRRTEHYNAVPSNVRQVERPSHLPLPTDFRSQKGASTHRSSRESTYKKQTFGPAVEEKCGTRFPPRPANDLCLDKPPKCKPVGVTQGVPQLHSSSTENLKLNHSSDQYSSVRSACKGKGEHAVTLQAGCIKHCKVEL